MSFNEYYPSLEAIKWSGECVRQQIGIYYKSVEHELQKRRSTGPDLAQGHVPVNVGKKEEVKVRVVADNSLTDGLSACLSAEADCCCGAVVTMALCEGSL